MKRFKYAFLALKELGIQKVSLYALYQFGIKTGHWKRLTSPSNSAAQIENFPNYLQHFPWKPPASSTITLIMGDQSADGISAANLILDGKIEFFHGKIGPLNLAPEGTRMHWTDIRDDDCYQDIKFIWEPARFCWAYTLCRAYLITHDEQYAETFWKYVQQFIENNPVNMGPNWVSGQEIALRMIAMIISGVVFKDSPTSTPDRQKALYASLYDHAARLPKTLIYARSQNNNHLITEAAGMFTAGIFFNNNEWKSNGWKWMETALQQQIDQNGSYIQQSTNYHRLMLQTVLWVYTLSNSANLEFSQETKNRLVNASKWIITHMDSLSGHATNLGHNDGSLIMPLSSCQYADYRPTAQAASIAFLERPYLAEGPWDEYRAWLGLVPEMKLPASPKPELFYQPHILRAGSERTWAILRAEKFSDRPAHADQLHIDLWWEGENIAMDPGTYRYTAPHPWMNGMASTRVHNTIEIDEQDQMLPVSRFLWLNWAVGQRLDSPSDQCMSAEHNGYRKLGAIHQRTICHTPPLSWTITDKIYSDSDTTTSHRICIHWLLPDWSWNLTGDRLALKKDTKQIDIWITATDQNQLFKNAARIQIIQAGKVISGPEESLPALGWFSPTYDVKISALSLRCVYQSPLPLEIKTFWNLKERSAIPD